MGWGLLLAHVEARGSVTYYPSVFGGLWWEQLIVVVVVVGKTAAVTRGDRALPNTETHGIQRVAPVADHPLGGQRETLWASGHSGHSDHEQRSEGGKVAALNANYKGLQRKTLRPGRFYRWEENQKWVQWWRDEAEQRSMTVHDRQDAHSEDKEG